MNTDIKTVLKDKMIKIGDRVVCTASGVSGVVIKQYYPTACAQQTMIETDDGRLYHAPTSTFVRLYGR